MTQIYFTFDKDINRDRALLRKYKWSKAGIAARDSIMPFAFGIDPYVAVDDWFIFKWATYTPAGERAAQTFTAMKNSKERYRPAMRPQPSISNP